MSLVVFPVLSEEPDVVLNNLSIAASHPRVQEVLCVAAAEEETFRAVSEALPALTDANATPVTLRLQQRIGTRRPGKGDGMNTALRIFLEETDHRRIHFYDADITSFDHSWISKAEDAADLGYQLVRHAFPRAATDAMITWLVTRPGFAILWPRTDLPWVQQPLGGELMLTRQAAEVLAADPLVMSRSDWGIDTLYTFAGVRHGLASYETYLPGGKLHSLYQGLDQLRTMVIECLAALVDLQGEPVPEESLHRAEPAGGVPAAIRTAVGFDLEATLRLPAGGWNAAQLELLDLFPPAVRQGMEAARRHPSFSFLDEDQWYDTLQVLFARFRDGDPDWEELAFKLWVTRVLAYTAAHALRGYERSQRYLSATIADYARRSALKLEGGGR